VQRLPTLGLRFDSSVGQRCLVAQTMNGAHNGTSQGGGSTSGGNGAAAQSEAGASSGNDGGQQQRQQQQQQHAQALTVAEARTMFTPGALQLAVQHQQLQQHHGSGSGSGRSTTDRLLRKHFFDLLVQVDTRCCVPC